MEAVVKHPGEMPEMQRFVEFFLGGEGEGGGGGGIWEQNEPTPNMPWMEEVKAELVREQIL